MKRPRWSRLTIRARLTLVYGGLFLVAGVLLLGVTYALVAQRIPGHGERVTSFQGSTRSLRRSSRRPQSVARSRRSWSATPGTTRSTRCSPRAGSHWYWPVSRRPRWAG